MGVYFTGPGAYGPLVFACKQCQPALVVIANEYKAVADVRRESPGTYIVYRETEKDFGISGAKAQQLLPWYAMCAPQANAYSIANEIMPRDGAVAIKAVCDGYIDAARVAKGMGLVITGGNINTGFPVLSHENLDAMTPMLQVYAGYGFPLAVHYYNRGSAAGDPDGLIWKTLADRAPGLKVIIEEYGILDNQMVKGEGFDHFLAYDDLLDDRVIGVAIFTLCSLSWPTCDYVDQLPRLIDHVRSWR